MIVSTFLSGWISDRYSFAPILVGASLVPLVATALVFLLGRGSPPEFDCYPPLADNPCAIGLLACRFAVERKSVANRITPAELTMLFLRAS
jgi:hypothetical protein